MALVRKRGWTGVYPMTEGQQFPRVGLGAYSSASDLASNPGINCRGAAQYLDPFCWSIWQGPIYGDKYPAPPMPPVVGSTLPDGSAIPAVPPDGASPQIVGVNAGQIVQSITDQQISDWQARNQQFFEDLNASLNPPDGPGPGINWWLWGGLAAVGVFALAVSGSGPRRYGR